MRSAIAAVIGAACALGACGDNLQSIVEAVDAAPPDAAPPVDAVPLPDARPANLDCNSDPVATAADDPVAVAGNAFSVSLGGTNPVDGAAIEIRAFSDPDGAAIETATADAAGDYAASVATGGTPLDVFIRATADGLLPTELFPPTVISADQTAPTVMFEAGTINLLAQFSGQDLDLDDNGVAVVLVLDCDQNPIEGAVVTAPSGSVVYAGASGLPDTSIERTSIAGTAFVIDVTPGADLTFDAEVMGMSLRENHVRIAAGTIATMAITPGAAP